MGRPLRVPGIVRGTDAQERRRGTSYFPLCELSLLQYRAVSYGNAGCLRDRDVVLVPAVVHGTGVDVPFLLRTTCHEPYTPQHDAACTAL